MVQTREQLYNVTQFGLQAMDRNLPMGIQKSIMEEIFQSGPITRSQVYEDFPSVDPVNLGRIFGDMIQRNWIEPIQE